MLYSIKYCVQVVQPLQCWLFTPESQWQSKGKRRISQGGRVSIQVVDIKSWAHLWRVSKHDFSGE